ncbi:MAG: hypothetical protein KJN76_14105, partial [Eudoraea sp.]|nr:hypothetical protein [Eudoraea sp.]
LVGYALIDKEKLPEKRQLANSALPRTGINIKLLTEVLSLFQDLSLHINETEPTTYRLRKMLIKSAETMPGYEGQDVGHGFVSKETTQNFLENFTATQLASIFCEGYTEELKLKEEVFHRSLVEPNTIGHLMDIWTMSQRRWPFDFERCKPSVLRKN